MNNNTFTFNQVRLIMSIINISVLKLHTEYKLAIIFNCFSDLLEKTSFKNQCMPKTVTNTECVQAAVNIYVMMVGVERIYILIIKLWEFDFRFISLQCLLVEILKQETFCLCFFKESLGELSNILLWQKSLSMAVRLFKKLGTQTFKTRLYLYSIYSVIVKCIMWSADCRWQTADQG